jgi:uncharacterized membrane protein YsdA (DUF1294 family)
MTSTSTSTSKLPKRRTTTSSNYYYYNYYTTALSIGAMATVGACLVLLLRTRWSPFAIWMTSINMTTFLLFAVDKVASKMTNKNWNFRYRIPEMVLHVFTMLGGVLGQRLGRAMFHHKSNIRRHPSFQRVQYASLVLWACLIYWYYCK